MEDVKKYIMAIYPTIAINPLMEKFTELGVEGLDDLNLLNEKDLEGLMKPIQIRKFFQSQRKAVCEEVSFESDASSSTISSRSTGSDTSMCLYQPTPLIIEKNTVQTDWPFEINPKISPKVLRLLTSGTLKPRERLIFVREIVDEIHDITNHPTKKQLSIVAQRMIKKFPALTDTIAGVIIGSGYDSLLKQLQSRSENLNRKLCTISLTKRKQGHLEESKINCYGCIMNNVYPRLNEEDIEELENTRKKMLDFEDQPPKDINWCKISEELTDTYVLQRHHIHKLTTKELVMKWPFLFKPKGLCLHFEILTGKNLKESVENFLDLKSDRLKKYLLTVTPPTDDIEQLNHLCQILILIMNYFDEDVASLFYEAEETASVREVEISNNLACPRLVSLGSVLKSPCYHVIVDGVVICSDQVFLNAFCALFATYYVLGIEYQANATSTLEFFQRSFVNINPGKGSKSSKKKKSLSCDGVHPKILKLIQNIGSFEWT